MELKAIIDHARSLAKEKDSKEAWSRLKTWASSESHPYAMKAAIFQFLEAHATDPSAVSLLPEVLHSATALPLAAGERTDLIKLTDKAFNTAAKLGPSVERPVPKLTISAIEEQKKLIYSPLAMSKDVEQLIQARDAIFHVNDSMKRVRERWKK